MYAFKNNKIDLTYGKNLFVYLINLLFYSKISAIIDFSFYHNFTNVIIIKLLL